MLTAALLEEDVLKSKAEGEILKLRTELDTKSLNTAKEQIEVTRLRIDELAPLVGNQPRLIEATAKAEALEKEIARLNALTAERDTNYLAGKQATLDKIAESQKVIDSIIINFEAEKQLKAAEEALSEAVTEWESHDKQRNELCNQINGTI